MAVKVPFASSLTFLDSTIADQLEGAFLSLYQNNYTPIGGTVLADLVEADFPGYAPIELVGWPNAALNADFKASTQLPMQFFTCSGSATPNNIYGVYVVSAVGDLLYVERNPSAPIAMNTAGQLYGYLPRFTDRSEV